ncbi:MAG: hypothetical protein EOO01_05900, partial [Chitinophagaceae bacterium]
MENTAQKEIHLSDLFSHIKPFIRFFLSKWLLILLAIILGVGLGLGYYYKQKPKYEAVCTFMIEEKQSSLGGLGGIASQFGFDVGSLSGGGSLFSGENIFEILRSKRIVNKVLLSKVDSAQSKGITLADLYISFSNEGKKIRKNEILKNVSFTNITGSLTPVQDTVLNIIYNKIIKKDLIVDRVSKRGNLTKVQVNAPQREFAIIFRRRDEGLQAYALLGLDRDENLFLSGDYWTSRYVPASHQRGPFSIGMVRGTSDAVSQPMLHVDRDDPRVGDDDGLPLFLEHGGNTPY